MLPSPTPIEIPDHGGAVAVMADLHLKSYFWHRSNPLEFHGLEDPSPTGGRRARLSLNLSA